MGTIFYGGSETAINVDDFALAHLKVVIATKLRRSESFMLSWRHPDDQPRGRSTIWLHPSIPLRFVFDEPEPPELSRKWIEEMASSANSSGGLVVIADDSDAEPADVVQGDASVLAGRKLEVGELTIDKLTVAGIEITGNSDSDTPALPSSEARSEPEL